MAILSIVELSLAGNALAKVTNKKGVKVSLLKQMEDYVTEDSVEAKRWDRLHIKASISQIKLVKQCR